MSARIPRSIASIAFVCALLLSTVGSNPLVGSAVAADCLTEPNAATPENGHWYYRTDRATQRKCWYLRAENPARQEVLQTAQAAPAADAHSFADFKSFIAQRGNAKMSEADVQTLYTQFLEWRRHAGAGDKERQ